MKYLSKLIVALLLITAFAACKKIADVPFSPNGKAVTLNLSANMVSPAPGDSAKNALTLFWTSPRYAQDSSLYKFVIEIDSTGRNFAKEYTLTAIGRLDTTLTGKALNDILAGLGVVAGAPSSIDVRVTSSYGNNNEAYTSNVITIKATPYVVPITVTPSSTDPIVLNVQNATANAITLNWNATGYGSIPFSYAVQVDKADGNFSSPQAFNVGNALNKSITILDLNNAALAAGIAVGASEKLEFRVVAYQGSNSTPSVISNVFTINVTTYSPLQYLWVPGDYQGWSPDAAPQLAAPLTSNDYEGYVNVGAGGSYEFKFTNAPDWSHTAYGGDATTLSTSGDNLKWPGAGYYLVKANPVALTWSATATSWGIIGDATPGGWDNSTPMTYDAASKTWTISSVNLTSNSMKFRANNGWNINLGGNLSGLTYGGDNIPVAAAGNYKIVLDLSHPLKYTATLTKL
jgi:starch-binding outer membrane protein SusE/F